MDFFWIVGSGRLSAADVVVVVGVPLKPEVALRVPEVDLDDDDDDDEVEVVALRCVRITGFLTPSRAVVGLVSWIPETDGVELGVFGATAAEALAFDA